MQRKVAPMKLLTLSLTSMLVAATSLIAVPAFADQADKDACVGLEEGDDCTRGDGSAGVCIPDESDPGVLTCDDDTASSGTSGGGSGGCSTSSGPASSLAGLVLLGAALAVSRRRRDSRGKRSTPS
ncbi:MAG: hypothetical protein IPK82_30495 [Polyangiaceae bacterium]|nr:hypothetical protein [Polyangiaceae bacterium]